LGVFASEGIELGDLFGSIFSSFSVVGIVGESDIDDVFFQGFFVPFGFKGFDK
jgi:hypothetical protein